MTDEHCSPDTGPDREIMGTPEAAKDALIEKAREWRRLRQPTNWPQREPSRPNPKNSAFCHT